MKYIVDSWIHAHYTSEIEADSFEEAKRLCECGFDKTEVNFNGLDIGDSGITCIEDEDGNEYWCE